MPALLVLLSGIVDVQAGNSTQAVVTEQSLHRRASHAWLWCFLVLLGFAPLLIRFGGDQWALPHYQFYPLMIIAAVFVGWQRLRDMPPGAAKPGGTPVTHALMALAVVLLAAAFVLWSGRAAAVGMMVVLTAFFWHLGGKAALRALVPAGVLLLIVIGPPAGIGDVGLQRLRELAVWASSRVLVWAGVVHMETGTVLEIKGARLLVAEACSGINSMMAVAGFTLVLSFLRHRTPRHTLLLLAFSIVFVVWANTVRIAGGVWLQETRGIDVLSGTAHEGASLLLFSVCMVLVASMDVLIQLVAAWIKQRRRRRRRSSAPTVDAGVASIKPRVDLGFGVVFTRGMWVAATLLALLGLAQLGNAAVRGGVRAWITGSGESNLPTGAYFNLSPSIAGWQYSAEVQKQLVQPELEGKQSQSWAYTRDGVVAIIAMDFPFAGYHDLTLCYRNAGWTQRGLQAMDSPQVGPYVTAEFTRLSEKGNFWYSQLDESGTWVNPPRTGLVGRVMDRFQHTGPPNWSAPVYQVQVWVQRYQALTEVQQQSINELFQGARAELRAQIMQQLQGAR